MGRHAGIIETEAALKAARICIEQNRYLDVAVFLQNVLYINLNLTEAERVQRFEVLTELYQRIGFVRKAAFCQRLASWRHVAQSNTNPDWNKSYRLMLESFPGHKLSLDPLEVIENNAGWKCLQIDLLQQLVAAARRIGANHSPNISARCKLEQEFYQFFSYFCRSFSTRHTPYDIFAANYVATFIVK